MKYYYLKIKSLINFRHNIKLFSVLIIILCLDSSTLSIYEKEDENLVKFDISFEDFTQINPVIEKISKKQVQKIYQELANSKNPLMNLYTNNHTNSYLVEYFTRFTGSQKTSLSILYYSYKYQIPPELAFALAWTESRFLSTATNTNRNSTVDRGLFQLNSKTFTNLDGGDFFDPDTNTLHGLKYLAWCLKQGKSVYNALVIYNAGIGRLHSVPESTLIYIDRITKKSQSIKANAIYYVRNSIENDKSLSDE